MIVVNILQKTDHFAHQQRIKLFNTQTIKKLNNDVFSYVNKNDQFFRKKTKIDENSNKKMTIEK